MTGAVCCWNTFQARYHVAAMSSHLDRALYTWSEIKRHPLTGNSRAKALLRWLRWQIGSRLVPGPIVVPLTDRASLLVSAGMHGATMNVFTGLADFEEMGFLLHYLRPGELFVDVGANVGVFGVLAGAVSGARVMLFEPGEKAFAALVQNLRLNGLDRDAMLIQKVASDHVGSEKFTSSLDTLNHVFDGESGDANQVVSVEATTLDAELAGQVPSLVKIDVEGFEASVIRGAAETLASPNIGAVIMELGNHSRRYGVDPNETFQTMVDFGFTPVSYDPIARRLTPYAKPFRLDECRDDTTFVKDVDGAIERLRSAKTVPVFGREF